MVIDAAGFPATWALGVQSARPGGHIDMIGLGAVEGPAGYHAIVAKGLTSWGPTPASSGTSRAPSTC